MDKKNTMLLTVIAVATLLVAVVGATFAYFSITTTADSATNTVTTEAEAVGTVALNGESALYINLSAAQMSQNLGGQATYYALPDADAAATTAVQSPATVATFTATEVDENDVAYTCTFDYTIETAGDEAALAVLAKDGYYNLTAGTGVTLDKTAFKLGTAANGSGTVNFNDGDTTTISAVAYVENTGEPQNALAGKSVSATLSFSNFKCQTK